MIWISCLGRHWVTTSEEVHEVGAGVVIARGLFTSVPDLTRKLRRYINTYSANAE
jgi:hypothetical protein